MSLQFRARLGVALLFLPGTALAAPIVPQKIAELPAFIDRAAQAIMNDRHVPGAVLAVVHQGRVVLLRNLGKARLDPPTPVDATETIFRIGSVSKFVTAIAALQLVDDGSLDLQRDIREYVPELPVAYRTTSHQLLTHTAAFGERFAGTFTSAPE